MNNNSMPHNYSNAIKHQYGSNRNMKMNKANYNQNMYSSQPFSLSGKMNDHQEQVRYDNNKYDPHHQNYLSQSSHQLNHITHQSNISHRTNQRNIPHNYNYLNNTNNQIMNHQKMNQSKVNKNNKKNNNKIQHIDNKITLVIKTQSNPISQLYLSLSPQTYNEDFKLFIKEHKISRTQAFSIKKIIVNKLRQLAYDAKYGQSKELEVISQHSQKKQSMGEEKQQDEYRQTNNNHEEQYYEEQKSPTFSPIQNINQEEEELQSFTLDHKTHKKIEDKEHTHLQLFQNEIQKENQLAREDEQEISPHLKQQSIKQNYINNYKRQEIQKVDKEIQTYESQLRKITFKNQDKLDPENQQNKKNIREGKKHKHSILKKKQLQQISSEQKNQEQSQINQFTPPKKYFLLENYQKNTKKSPTNIKYTQKQNYSHPKSPMKKCSKSKSQKKETPKSHKKDFSIDQRQLNYEVFFRLNSQYTASFKQKFLPQPNAKEQKDFQQIQDFIAMKNKSSVNKPNDEVFDKLHMTSTESSFNRYKKSEPQEISSNQMEIQKFINLNSNVNRKSMKRLPNMQSRVYSPSPEKHCNQHCQKYEYEKKIKRQNALMKQKQQNLKRMIKSRSKSSGSLNYSDKKKSGQCPCCHYDKIQQSIKKKNKLLSDKKKKKQSPIKGPNLKIKFISDVLSQSYYQLFPQKG